MSHTAIYVPEGLDGYEYCHPINTDDFENIHIEISGSRRHTMWRPIAMRLIRDDQGRKLASSDSPWLGNHALIFRSNVVCALGAFLQRYGELLPLSCKDANLSIYNPTCVVDALDETASSATRFSSGRVMLIKRYVFRSDVISGIDIFKIPDLRVSPTFVSQRFVDLWNSHGLKGLEFKLVWPLSK